LTTYFVGRTSGAAIAGVRAAAVVFAAIKGMSSMGLSRLQLIKFGQG
jgi:hypothetical protein